MTTGESWSGRILNIIGVVWIVGHIVFSMLPIIGWFILNPLFGLAMFIVMIICAAKHYGGQRFKLPVLGDWAEKQADQ